MYGNPILVLVSKFVILWEGWGGGAMTKVAAPSEPNFCSFSLVLSPSTMIYQKGKILSFWGVCLLNRIIKKSLYIKAHVLCHIVWKQLSKVNTNSCNKDQLCKRGPLLHPFLNVAGLHIFWSDTPTWNWNALSSNKLRKRKYGVEDSDKSNGDNPVQLVEQL